MYPGSWMQENVLDDGKHDTVIALCPFIPEGVITDHVKAPTSRRTPRSIVPQYLDLP